MSLTLSSLSPSLERQWHRASAAWVTCSSCHRLGRKIERELAPSLRHTGRREQPFPPYQDTWRKTREISPDLPFLQASERGSESEGKREATTAVRAGKHHSSRNVRRLAAAISAGSLCSSCGRKEREGEMKKDTHTQAGESQRQECRRNSSRLPDCDHISHTPLAMQLRPESHESGTRMHE